MVSIYVVDAFTSVPCTGNPAAVCLLPADCSRYAESGSCFIDSNRDHPFERWMRFVAQEMNLSETAFIFPTSRPNVFRIRWLTPTKEVKLCGHATLASAYVLFQKKLADGDQIIFLSLSGELRAKLSESSTPTNPSVILDFPAAPAFDSPVPDGVFMALGVASNAVVWSGRNEWDYVIELDSDKLLAELSPDFASLKAAAPSIRSIEVTAKKTDSLVVPEELLASSSLCRHDGDLPSIDFVSRVFCPAVGIDEDPVTGSAQCCLAPYWSLKLSKTEFMAYQASERGGIIRLRLTENGKRVEMAGDCVFFSEGLLTKSPPPPPATLDSTYLG